MAGTLRDDLASLKIDRSRGRGRGEPSERVGRRGGEGFGLLAAVLWLVPVVLLGGAGTYAYRQYDQMRAKPEVSIGVVQTMTPGEAEKLLSAKGYLKSRFQAMIGAKVPGRVERMLVEEGTKVKKGDVLAVLEHNDLNAQLASRQAQVEKAKADIAKAEADLEEATVDRNEKEREAKRARRLYSQKTASQEEVEKTEASHGMTTARVKGIAASITSLRASIKLMEANVREVEETIRNMSLYAPFDGTVVEKQGEEGEVITPSAMSTATGRSAVVTLANLSKMDVETDVAENLMSRVALGQPAEISVSAVPSKHYQGRLRQIIPMGDRARGTVKVKVEVLDPDEHLFPELVATVHFLPDKGLINPDSRRSFLFVPKAALVDENGHTYVWVVADQGRIEKRVVEVAVTTDDLARVESGLKAGESVILNPAKTLRAGALVKAAD